MTQNEFSEFDDMIPVNAPPKEKFIEFWTTLVELNNDMAPLA